MIDLTLSQRIENLLVQIAPSYNGIRNVIEREPYGIIIEVLQYRLPQGAIYFANRHYKMGNRRLLELKEDGYNTEQIVQDLKEIIDKGE